MEKLNELLEEYEKVKGSLIGLLQDMHEEFGYLPEEYLREASRRLNIPLSRFYSLVTFYSTFRLEPIGKHHVCACVGTACHVRGAPLIVDTIERELKIKAGETTADGEYTLDVVNCVGACALGPLVTVDGEFHGKMTQKTIKKLMKKDT
ncbi:MAG: NAD(P)H-dependent oxidoreductase subunit E [Spirochaetia bacterium]|jgi:NADH-quinone oxidoreductase subunit E|nr:NAD(P)H-dependent oxidoreductase subunit E [Spirochaetia bacterium]